MTAELHHHAVARKRRTEDLIREAHDRLLEIGWINPNAYPVYMSHHYAALLRDIRREAEAILAKHEEAEKELQNG